MKTLQWFRRTTRVFFFFLTASRVAALQFVGKKKKTEIVSMFLCRELSRSTGKKYINIRSYLWQKSRKGQLHSAICKEMK